ncbi:uncharacterized protein EV422DRAFT_502141 [Fimicolochytrium jonesii]|uniref:uncharacterized protein n=1 Tax=Fimicolochytrium jonesii TaxID=1396493 RepID=UPI0022FED002|nr:uncharacterized protein EV422DRAFT_502141 [Fimicolochytrium jonesii]KAI8815734.1 hypothetical protein EV422DRAFT_502141 [Fimicolochytrium jonesii]
MTEGQRAKRLVVMYASQTGNAEWMAKHIHEESLARGYTSTCHVLDDHAKASLASADHDPWALVVVASTTGDGDPPDNATKFWRWLRRAKGPELEAFKGKKFAVLGLGDTNYSNFCNTGKRLDRKFNDLGAVPFMKSGFADDATGMEAVVEPWMEKLWTALPEVVDFDEAKAKAYEENADKQSKLDLGKFGNGDHSSVSDAFTPPLSTESHNRLESGPYFPQPLVINLDALNKAAQLTGVAKIPSRFLEVTLHDTETRSTEESKGAGVFPLLLSPADTTSAFDYTATKPFRARITAVRSLSGPKALKRVIELKLNIKGLKWSYEPGDAFGILCPNPDTIVNPLLTRLNLTPSSICDIQPKDASAGAAQGLPFTTTQKPTTYEVFRYFLDLHAFPKKALLRMLAEHTSDQTEKRTLYFLAAKEGAAEYRNLRTQQPTLLDILHTFPTCSPPLAHLIENLPNLQPRYYSVSSSPLNDTMSDAVTIGFNIVEYTTDRPFNKPMAGICSTWLDSLTGHVSPGNRDWAELTSEVHVPIFPKPQPASAHPFKLPSDPQTPIVMIAAGTGLTPFMSFLSHRGHRASSDTAAGPTLLIHGRRFATPDADGLYDPELATHVAEGTLTRFVPCHSRETEPSGHVHYRYVQDALRALGADIYGYMTDAKAVVYVCGSVAMAKEVNAALVDVVVEQGGAADKPAAVEVVNAWAKEGRYLRDIWA